MNRTYAMLWLLGVVIHAAWATTLPAPVDLDATYYLLVARNLVAGHGAVTASLWNLAVLPESLPLPADLHWMPLPSRILVPFLWLWPAHGDQLVQVALAASWAPLTAWLARDLGASTRTALGAGVLAATGGVYVRYLSSPDVYGLYGLLGALGLMSVARQRWQGAALVALLAGATRNDGFLLGLALALGLGGWRGLATAVSGLVAPVLWALRGQSLVGAEAYWRGRSLATDSGDYLSVFDGVNHAPLTAMDHLLAPLRALPELGEFVVTPGLLLLTPFTAWAAWRHRDEAWVRAFAAMVLVVPVVTVALAPAVAVHGTLYRLAAATMPGHLALAAVALVEAGRRAAALRGYPPAFLPALVGGGFVVVVFGMGLQRAATPPRPSECPAVADLPEGAPVLTSRPLEMELDCGRPGVLVTRRTPADRVAEVVARYDVRYAVTSPDARRDEGSVLSSDLDRLLPTWTARGDHLRAAPTRRDPGDPARR